MTADAKIREFVAEQKELLELELQSETDGGEATSSTTTEQHNEEQRASHILSHLYASEVSVGLYGRTVVELSLWNSTNGGSSGSAGGEAAAENNHGSSDRLPAHRFTVGDEVEVRSKQRSSKRKFPGGVISVVTDSSISIALFPQRNEKSSKKKSQASSDAEEGEDDEDDLVGPPPLSLVPKSSIEVHRKLVHALDILGSKGVDHPVAGHVVDAMFRVPHNLPSPSASASTTTEEPFNARLDASQLEAISFALQSDRPVSLIHGPPGTGKTTTVAELIHQAVKVHQMKVLVTAPSNVAVDNILERLVQLQEQSSLSASSSSHKKKQAHKKLRAVRLGHPARIKASILPFSLEALVQSADGTEIVADVRKELQSFLKVLSNPKSRASDKRVAYREVKNLRKEVRTREEKVVAELVTGSQVVLATTVGAANSMLDKVEGGFDLVIIDEAAQALEASCWIPILRGRKVVLAGDHCQLPPTIKSRHPRAQSDLSKTMFERLMELYGDNDHNNTPRISRMLKVQYRMHQMIADWASQAMYGGELATDKGVKDRLLNQLEGVDAAGSENDEELARTPMLLIDTAGCDMFETVNAAGSRFNDGEAEIVAHHVRNLIGIGVDEQQIAVITPYNGQVELLRGFLLPDFPKLEIRSVDGFQGGEREAVVLSLVRSSEKGGRDGIGFLRDDRRQNVAISRAKRHLCVVCDTDTVSQSAFMKNLISWIEAHGDQRSAMEFLTTTDGAVDLDNDLRDAEAELMKLVEQQTMDDSALPSETSHHKMASKPSARPSKEDEDENKRKALMENISAFAENGAPGQELVFSQELSSYDRRLVHELAEQLNLEHRSEGTAGLDRRIIVKIKDSKPAPVQHDAASESTQTLDKTEGDKAHTKSVFASMAIDDDDDDDSDENSKESPRPTKATEEREKNLKKDVSSSSTGPNQLLASLAKERREREQMKHGVSSSTQATGTSKNKKKKKKAGGKKQGPGISEEDKKLEELDDMAFLDAMIVKSENSHGRKVEGSGKGYKTIVNGILNSRPTPKEAPKNDRASNALKSKLKQAQDGRKAKLNTSKRKK